MAMVVLVVYTSQELVDGHFLCVFRMMQARYSKGRSGEEKQLKPKSTKKRREGGRGEERRDGE